MDHKKKNKHVEIVEHHLNNDANFDAKSYVGRTALILASIKHYTKIVEFLTDKNADINIVYQDLTPLDWALKYGHAEIIALLQEKLMPIKFKLKK